MPRPLAVREVKFPPYEVRTLPNGMQVVIVLHHEQPAVSIRLLVRAGSIYDPQGKPGVASLAASLLDQGTTTKSAAQIADAIDYIGGALGTGAGSDLTFINGLAMKDSFGTVMDLIADVARNPAFAPEEMERQRKLILSSMQVNRTDPAYIANEVFDRLVYGFHPYGKPGGGTPESLVTITRADLQAYHKKYFVPNNMILGIVGDVTSQEAFAAAERVFGKWARAEIGAVKVVDPPPPTRRVVVVDMPGAVQTEVRVGQLGIQRKHPDYLPVELAFRILGGEGANRLHRVLRSERGLTYGASADIDTWKTAGDFVAETNTRTETTGEALKLTIEEFVRLQRERVGDRELADAQTYLAGNFPLTIESPDAIATQVLNNIFYELPVSEIGTFSQRVQSVTPDDIQRAARTYVFPDRLSVVLVGDASAFVPQLKAAGFADYEVIPIDQLDISSATLRKDRLRVTNEPSRKLPLARGQPGRLVHASFLMQASAEQASPTVAGARELIAKAIEAKGGLAALKGVRTVVAEARTTFRVQPAPLPSTTTTYVLYPDRFRVDADVAGAKVAQVYDRGAAWLRDPNGLTDAPVAMRAQFAASVQRDLIPLLLGAAEGTRTARVLPEEKKDGRTYSVVEISGGISKDPVRLYIDTNGLVARQGYIETNPLGRRVQVEEVFSDYRPVDGIQVPFHAELRHNGAAILDRVLTSVKINSEIDPAMFQKPGR
jgi:predicted Zn-dependent peptidase